MFSELEVVETVNAYARKVEVVDNLSDKKHCKADRVENDSYIGDRPDHNNQSCGAERFLDDHIRLNFYAAKRFLLDQTLDVVEDKAIGRKASFCFPFGLTEKWVSVEATRD